MNEHINIKAERGGWRRVGRRHVAGAVLVALGIAAGASTQLVSAAPAPEATPELLAQLSAEAGSAWAGRVAIADQYGEVRAEQARQARVDRQAGSDRHLAGAGRRGTAGSGGAPGRLGPAPADARRSGG